MNFTTACLKTVFSKPTNKYIWFIAMVLLFGCNKPGSDYLISGSGKGLLGIQKTDTISLNLVTDYWPSIPEAENLSVDNIGTIMDPVFGRTTAGVYTQVRIGDPVAPVWSKTSTMDSLVLTLKVSDTAAPIGNNHFAGQTWHLWKMFSGFGSVGTNGSSYYPSDTTFPTWEIGHALVRYNAKDSVVTLSLNAAAINSVFRDSLFDSTGNSALFTDPTEFDLLMHGILIMPDTVLSGAGNNGEIAPFNIANDTTHSRLTVYYRTSGSSTEQNWYMFMNNSPEKVNVYSHNYKNAVAWKNNGLNGKSVDKVYVQSMGGMKCIVTMPYLANLVKDSMIAINQAEFIFPKVDSIADPFNSYNPPKLLFRPRAYNGKDSITNFTDDITDYFLQEYQTNTKSYNYLMTRYIQRLVFNYRNKKGLYAQYGINLSVPPDNPNSPGRVLLYTQNTGNKNKRPKLVITYTKIVDGK